MLVLAEPTGNWTFSLTFHINSFIKLCQGLATSLEVYLEKILLCVISCSYIKKNPIIVINNYML